MQTVHPPPFPERLFQEKLPMPLPQFDIIDELRNVYVKIPLLQAIKTFQFTPNPLNNYVLRSLQRKDLIHKPFMSLEI